MKKLKDVQFAPPGGWHYEEPSTGKVFKSIVKSTLITEIKNHRISHGIPVGNVEADVENFICVKNNEQWPGLCLEDEGYSDAPIKSKYTVADVRAFGESVAHTLKSGGVVSKEEANRRASICLGCKLNVKVEGCTSCSKIASFIYGILGARADDLAYKERLLQCGNCGCALAAKVWISKQELKSNQQIEGKLDSYPKWCWMKESQD